MALCDNCQNQKPGYIDGCKIDGDKTGAEETCYCEGFTPIKIIVCGNCSNFSKTSQTNCLFLNEDEIQGLDEEFTDAFPVSLKTSMSFCDGYSEREEIVK